MLRFYLSLAPSISSEDYWKRLYCPLVPNLVLHWPCSFDDSLALCAGLFELFRSNQTAFHVILQSDAVVSASFLRHAVFSQHKGFLDDPELVEASQLEDVVRCFLSDETFLTALQTGTLIGYYVNALGDIPDFLLGLSSRVPACALARVSREQSTEGANRLALGFYLQPRAVTTYDEVIEVFSWVSQLSTAICDDTSREKLLRLSLAVPLPTADENQLWEYFFDILKVLSEGSRRSVHLEMLKTILHDELRLRSYARTATNQPELFLASVRLGPLSALGSVLLQLSNSELCALFGASSLDPSDVGALLKESQNLLPVLTNTATKLRSVLMMGACIRSVSEVGIQTWWQTFGTALSKKVVKRFLPTLPQEILSALTDLSFPDELRDFSAAFLTRELRSPAFRTELVRALQISPIEGLLALKSHLSPKEVFANLNLWENPSLYPLFHLLCCEDELYPVNRSNDSPTERIDEIIHSQLDSSRQMIDAILDGKSALRSIVRSTEARGEIAGLVMTATTQKNINLMRKIVFEGGKRFLCLEGETGVGKTATVMHLSEIASVRTTRINCSAATSPQQLFGHIVSKSEGNAILGFQFQFGPLLEAWRKGQWVVLDEFNLLRSSVQQQIEQLLREETLPLHNFCSEESDFGEFVHRHPQFCLFATQNPSGEKYQRESLDSNLSTLLHKVPFEPMGKQDFLDIGYKKLAGAPQALVEFLVDWHLKMCKFSVDIQKSLPPASPESSILEVTVRDYLSVIKAIQHISEAGQSVDLLDPRLSEILDAVYLQRIPSDSLDGAPELPSKIDDLFTDTPIYVESTERVVFGNWALRRKPEVLEECDELTIKVHRETCKALLSADFIADHGLYFCDSSWALQCSKLASETSIAYAWRVCYLAKLRAPARERLCKSLDIIASILPNRNPELSCAESASAVVDAPVFLTSSVRRRLHYLAISSIVRRPLLIGGHLGSGKTAVIRSFALLRGCTFRSVQITPDASENTLIGGMQPDPTNLMSWMPGVVTKAAKEGSVLCLDAISRGNADLLERLNPLLETPPVLVVEGHPSSEGDYNVAVSEYFSVASTISPLPPSQQSQLTAALASRHLVVRALKTDDIVPPYLAKSNAGLMSNISPAKFFTTLNACYRLQARLTDYGVEHTLSEVTEDVFSLVNSSRAFKMKIDYVKLIRKKYPDRVDPNIVCDEKLTPMIYRTCNQIICALLCGLPLLLEGPPAAGKTTLVQYVAPLLDARGGDFDPCLRYICHEDTQFSDLLGRWRMKQNKPNFVSGPLTTAVAQGHILLLDELNLADHNSTIGVLVPLLDSGTLNMVHAQILSDSRFCVVACQNGVQLPGRKALPEEMLRRFVRLDVGDWAKTSEIENIFLSDPLPKELFIFKNRFDEEFSCQIDLRLLKRWRHRVQLATNSDSANLQTWAQHGYELLLGQVTSVSPVEGPVRLRLLLETCLKAKLSPLHISAFVEKGKFVLRRSDSEIVFQANPVRALSLEWKSLMKTCLLLPQNALQTLFLCARALETGEETPVIVGPPSFKSTVASALLSLYGTSNVSTIWISPRTTVSDFLGKLLPVPHSAVMKQVVHLLPEDVELNSAVKLWCVDKSEEELLRLIRSEKLNISFSAGDTTDAKDEDSDSWGEQYSFGDSDEGSPEPDELPPTETVVPLGELRERLFNFICDKALAIIASCLDEKLSRLGIVHSPRKGIAYLSICEELASKIPHHSTKHDAALHALELVQRCKEEGFNCGSLFVKMDGALSDAARRGAFCILEDIESAPASVLESINGLFENDRMLPGVEVPPTFRCVATCSDLTALSAAMHSRLTIVQAHQGYSEADKVALTLPSFRDFKEEDVESMWIQVVKTLDKNMDFVPIRLLFDLRDHIMKQSKDTPFVQRLAKALQLLILQMAGVSEIQKVGIVSQLPTSIQSHVRNLQWMEGKFHELCERSGLPGLHEFSDTAGYVFPEINSGQRFNIAACAAAISVGRPVVLVGDSGQGKTALAEAFSKLCCPNPLRRRRLVLSGGTSLADLVGRFEQKIIAGQVHFVWYDGPLLSLLRDKTGGESVLILDGISECDPEILSVLLPLFLHNQVQLTHELEPLHNPNLRIIGTMSEEGLRNLPRSILRACAMVDFKSLEISDLRIIAVHDAAELLEKGWISERLLETVVEISESFQKKAAELNLPSSSYSLRGILRTLDLYRHAIATKHYEKEEMTDDLKSRTLFQQLELVFLGSVSDQASKTFVSSILRQRNNRDTSSRENARIVLDLPSACRLGDVFFLKTITSCPSAYHKIMRKFAVAPAHDNLLRLALALQSRSLVVLSGRPGSGRASTARLLAASVQKQLVEIQMSSETDASDLVGRLATATAKQDRLILAKRLREKCIKFSSSLANFSTLAQLDTTTLSELVCRLLEHIETPNAIHSKLIENTFLEIISLIYHNQPEVEPEVKNLENEVSGILNKLKRLEGLPDNQLCFRFSESPLVRAMRRGEWVLLHDINCVRPDQLAGLASLFERSPLLRVQDTDLTLENGGIHKEFRVIATMDLSRPQCFTLNEVVRNRAIEISVEAPMSAPHLSAIVLAQVDVPSAVADVLSIAHLQAKKSEAASDLTLHQLITAAQFFRRWTCSGMHYIHALELALENIYGATIRTEIFSRANNSVLDTLTKITDQQKEEVRSEKGRWKQLRGKFESLLSPASPSFVDFLAQRLKSLAADWFNDAFSEIKHCHDVFLRDSRSLLRKDADLAAVKAVDSLLSSYQWMLMLHNCGLESALITIKSVLAEMKRQGNYSRDSQATAWLIANFENILVTPFSELKLTELERLLELSKSYEGVVFPVIRGLTLAIGSFGRIPYIVLEDELMPNHLRQAFELKQHDIDFNLLWRDLKVVDEDWRMFVTLGESVEPHITSEANKLLAKLSDLHEKWQDTSLTVLCKQLWAYTENPKLLPRISKLSAPTKDSFFWALKGLLSLRESAKGQSVALFLNGIPIGTNLASDDSILLGINKGHESGYCAFAAPNSNCCIICYDPRELSEQGAIGNAMNTLPPQYRVCCKLVSMQPDFDITAPFYVFSLRYLLNTSKEQSTTLFRYLESLQPSDQMTRDSSNASDDTTDVGDLSDELLE